MLQWKIPHAATKTWHSQINTFLFFNKKISLPSTYKYPPGTLHWSHTHFQSALQTVARMFFLKMQIWSSLSPVYKPPVTSTAIFPSPTLHFLALAAHKTSLRSVSVRSLLCHTGLLWVPWAFQHSSRHMAFRTLLSLPRTPCPVSFTPLPLSLLTYWTSVHSSKFSSTLTAPDSNKCLGLCCHAILWLPFGRVDTLGALIQCN